MAICERLSKRREDDDLSSVQRAYVLFDAEAPEGSYAIDAIINDLVRNKNIKCLHPLYVIRRHIKDSIADAHLTKRGADIIPSNIKAATEFLNKIDQVRLLLSEIAAAGPSDFAYLMVQASPFYGDGKHLEPEVEVANILEATEDVGRQAKALCDRFDLYRREFDLPTFKKSIPSNRTNIFVFQLVDHIVLWWTDLLKEQPLRSDLKILTDLVAAALSDFGFPLSHAQKSNTTWLSDRIRKHLFRN